ncbi:MAG: hypothetical protein KatS3mg102_1165 [Planctomycetota bacterium]|nr:MAG: hypothetical protein KatS3mg102_1165 [Planctomycetota bacterium]
MRGGKAGAEGGARGTGRRRTPERAGPRAARAAGTAGEAGTAGAILRAAERLFGEHGYEGTSVQQLAQLAGVNKALVFYHFGSKQQLFDAVLERYYRAHARAIRQAIRRARGGPRERIHQLLDGYLDFMERHRVYPRLVQQELARRSGRLELIRRNLGELASAVRTLLAGLCPEQGPLAPEHFFASFAGMVVTWFTHAPALGELWARDPLGTAMRRERRAHLHWVVDALLDRLLGERGPHAQRRP